MLITINGKTEVINGMQDIKNLLDNTFGYELSDCIEKMYARQYRDKLDELDCLLYKRRKKIIQLLRKIKQFEYEAKEDNDCYFHLEKDKEFVASQLEAVNLGIDSLIRNLNDTKKLDKKTASALIARLEEVKERGENVPLF